MCVTIYIAIKKLIDKRTNSGWTSSGHTAIDVPVFAFGKSSEMFHGKIDNTDIAKKIFTLLKILSCQSNKNRYQKPTKTRKKIEIFREHMIEQLYFDLAEGSISGPELTG